MALTSPFLEGLQEQHGDIFSSAGLRVHGHRRVPLYRHGVEFYPSVKLSPEPPSTQWGVENEGN